MSAKNATQGFWDFSLRTYRSEGVPDACLSLQDEHGADVNMLLYCCWIGAYIGQFDKALFAAASEFSKPWADRVVIPLRSARTWMKHTGCFADPMPTEWCMQLRDQIKKVEFASEKLQQQVLESLVSVEKSPNESAEQVLDDVVANLMLYSDFAGIDVSEDVRRKFATVILAAFPDGGEQNVNRALDL